MEMDYSKVVPELLRSYRELGGLNKCDSSTLPSKRAIAEICEEFLILLFPGFFDTEVVPESEMEMLTLERMAAMNRELHKQVAKSFQCSRGENDECLKTVTKVVMEFLQSLPHVRSLLKTDVEAAYEGDPAATSFEEIILAYPCIEAIAIQRLAHELYKLEVPILPRIMTEWAHLQTGIDIHPGASIGPYFFIDHGTGVVIGETCVIGSHVKLYDGVTLGARSFPRDEQGRIVKGIKRHPNVEDHVTVYANAIILGGETTIGANSTIGANAFIMESVAANSLVALGELEHKIVVKSPPEGSAVSNNAKNQEADPPKVMFEDPAVDRNAAEAPPRVVRALPRGVDPDLTAICRQLARELALTQLAKRVTVSWNRRLTSTAGNANHQNAQINLNPRLREISEREVDRTMRHELAHLVAYARAGRRRIEPHGREWRQACVELGIPEEPRCHDLPLPRRRQKPKYAYQCPNCLEVLLRIRPLKRYSACYSCCSIYRRGRYSSRFAYETIPLQLGVQLAQEADCEPPVE